MYTLFIRRHRAAGCAFWLAVLLLGGVNAATGWMSANPTQSTAVAWLGDDDPDEGGQTA